MKPLGAEELTQTMEAVKKRSEQPSADNRETWSRKAEEIRAAFPMSGVAMSQVVVLFRESCIDRLSRIQQALVTRSADEIARNAHALKGSLGMFASSKSIEVIAELEQQALEGNYESVQRLLETLRHAIECLEPTLDRLTL